MPPNVLNRGFASLSPQEEANSNPSLGEERGPILPTTVPQPKCLPGVRWAERATKGFVRIFKKPTKPQAGIITARLQSNALGQKSCLLIINKVLLI